MNMIINRGLVVGVLLFWGLSFPLFAQGNVYADGGIEGNISIRVASEPDFKQMVTDLRLYSTPNQGARFATIIVNNNDIDGFGINIHSERQGKLTLYRDNSYPLAELDGNYLSYTVDLIRGTAGILGTDMPPPSERSNINLATDYEVLFDDNVIQGTQDAELSLMIHTQANPDLFHGLFRDVFTVSIRDL